ncbi:cysteine-rich CWC family protein [Shewanella maritima]|uniref:cysteine-rich CWC family protein n=1 Tax=Shewanella maritima TaxID=2520507 RepID=UPI0037360824
MSSSAALCPICLHENGCAMVRGESIEQCWCLERGGDITQALNAYLQANPEHNIKADKCLCANCCTKLQAMFSTKDNSLPSQLNTDPIVKHYKP